MSSVLGLKVSPSTAMVLPRRLPPSAAATLRAIPRFLASFTAATISTMRSGASASCAVLMSATVSLGKARAAEARSGMEELAADAVVEADAARDLLDVAADLLAEIGDLIDEGDLGAEEGVGGVFDEVGRTPGGVEHRRLVEIGRPVELRHHLPRALVDGVDDDAVGVLEFLDRRAFAEIS
jgi:hypothetical protein